MISISKEFFRWRLIKKFFYFHIFSFFLDFKHYFIKCVDCIRIAALNTASDDVTK